MTAFLDVPTWLQTELAAGLPPTWRITPEQDATLDRFPCVVWALSLSNPDRTRWSANLTLSVLCAAEDAQSAAASVHALVEGWRTPGPLHDVTLLSFTPGPSDRPRIRRFTFVYTLTWA